MRQGLCTLICGMLVLGLHGCNDSEDRKARYSEKKPAPRPLEKNFEPPRQILSAPSPKKTTPDWMNYQGEDMRQLTELAGRNVLIVFHAPWSEPAMQYVQAVKSYVESQDGKAFAVLINADAYPELARKYKLEAVPMTILYLEGMKLREMVGGLSSSRLNELIEKTIRVP